MHAQAKVKTVTFFRQPVVSTVPGSLIGSPVHTSSHRCDVSDICGKLVRALGLAHSEMASLISLSTMHRL